MWPVLWPPVIGRLRREVKQARHYLHPYREDRRAVTKDLAAWRGISLPRLARRRRTSGSVWAVSIVKNEADIIGLALDHMLEQGVDHILIADNLSSDGTRELLESRASADSRVHLAFDSEPRFFQAAKMTRLAQVAALAGADWIIPFDADEFWYAEGRAVADYLRLAQANALRTLIFNAVATTRDGQPARSTTFLVDSAPHYDEKVAFRAHPLARLEMGNHRVGRVGPAAVGLRLAHVPYRGVEQMRRKFLDGNEALRETGDHAGLAAQWRQGAGLDADEVAEAWENVRSGRAEPRITWLPMTEPIEAEILTWKSWHGSQID
jgi:hypothetical protein